MCDFKRKSNVSTNVDINLGHDFVTNKAAASVLLSIVKFLSFNRNQIPFVFETFHYMAKKLEKAKSMQNEESVCKSFVKSYAMERQRDIAIQTYRKFNEMSTVSLLTFAFHLSIVPQIIFALFCSIEFQVLIDSFDKHDIEQAIVMFGATPFTPKEAFFINLPNITRNHFEANHPNSMETISRKVLR